MITGLVGVHPAFSEVAIQVLPFYPLETSFTPYSRTSPITPYVQESESFPIAIGIVEHCTDEYPRFPREYLARPTVLGRARW